MRGVGWIVWLATPILEKGKVVNIMTEIKANYLDGHLIIISTL